MLDNGGVGIQRFHCIYYSSNYHIIITQYKNAAQSGLPKPLWSRKVLVSAVSPVFSHIVQLAQVYEDGITEVGITNKI